MFDRFRPLRPYLVRYKSRFIVGFVCLIVGQSVGALVPLVIKAGIDDLMHHAVLHRLGDRGRGARGFSLIKAVFQFWTRWILIGISRDAEYDLRNDLFRHLLRLSPRYYTEHRTGDLMSKLTNDLNAVRNMIGPGIMYSATTVVIGIATIALMIHLDWKLTLMSLAPLPLVSVGVKFFGAKIHERFEKIQALYSELTERVRENISGVRVVRAFCQEDAEMATLRRDEPRLCAKEPGLDLDQQLPVAGDGIDVCRCGDDGPGGGRKARGAGGYYRRNIRRLQLVSGQS